MKLSTLVTAYLAYKRALGHRFTQEGSTLHAFSRHVGQIHVTELTTNDIRAFIQGGHTASSTKTRKYRVLAGLSRYARGRRQIVPLPPVPRLGSSTFVPYIYSEDDLKRLLGATVTVCIRRSAMDAYVLRALLLVFYGAGLRLSEALALNLADADLEQAVLTIRRTKFYKSRLVPLGRDLARALREYRRQRDRRRPTGPTAPFFCARNGERVTTWLLEGTFRRLRVVAGVHRDGGPRRQPRLHDLRHAAAVHRVIQWYRQGRDVQRLLPYLATYLGHIDLSSTQRYLTLTPSLLHEASRRFERYAMEDDHA
jgi:integrase